jgi:hypothetical protein
MQIPTAAPHKYEDFSRRILAGHFGLWALAAAMTN